MSASKNILYLFSESEHINGKPLSAMLKNMMNSDTF